MDLSSSCASYYKLAKLSPCEKFSGRGHGPKSQGRSGLLGRLAVHLFPFSLGVFGVLAVRSLFSASFGCGLWPRCVLRGERIFRACPQSIVHGPGSILSRPLSLVPSPSRIRVYPCSSVVNSFLPLLVHSPLSIVHCPPSTIHHSPTTIVYESPQKRKSPCRFFPDFSVTPRPHARRPPSQRPACPTLAVVRRSLWSAAARLRAFKVTGTLNTAEPVEPGVALALI